MILSMKRGVFLDEKLFLRSSSRKKAVFLDGIENKQESVIS